MSLPSWVAVPTKHVRLAGIVALLTAAWLAHTTVAQVYSSTTICNPITTSCPPVYGLQALASTSSSGTVSWDLSTSTSDPLDPTNAIGTPYFYGDPLIWNSAKKAYSYSWWYNTPNGLNNGQKFTSTFAFMYGKVTAVIQAAQGTGACTTLTLVSDDGDEIDFEMLGFNGQEFVAQTNWFGRKYTGSYDRSGQYKLFLDAQTSFHTYVIEYTPNEIKWSVNGRHLRTVTRSASTAEQGYFPDSPMRVRIGGWTPGDPYYPTASAGVQAWAGGEAAIPNSSPSFVMYINSLMVEDYSTGYAYEYANAYDNPSSVPVSIVPVSVGTSTTSTMPSAAIYTGTGKITATTTVASLTGSPPGNPPWGPATVINLGAYEVPPQSATSILTTWIQTLPAGAVLYTPTTFENSLGNLERTSVGVGGAWTWPPPARATPSYVESTLTAATTATESFYIYPTQADVGAKRDALPTTMVTSRRDAIPGIEDTKTNNSSSTV